MPTTGHQQQRHAAPPSAALADVDGFGRFFHISTLDIPMTKANPQKVVVAPNPWERLAMCKVLPSIFACDPHFTCGKRITNTSEGSALSLGILSSAGEKGYLQRAAVRKNSPVITKSEPGRIPNALRSAR